MNDHETERNPAHPWRQVLRKTFRRSSTQERQNPLFLGLDNADKPVHLGFLALASFPTGFPASEELEIFPVASADFEQSFKSRSSEGELIVLLSVELSFLILGNKIAIPGLMSKIHCLRSGTCSLCPSLLYLDVEWDWETECTRLSRPAHLP